MDSLGTVNYKPTLYEVVVSPQGDNTPSATPSRTAVLKFPGL